jgi:hypothetical protein
MNFRALTLVVLLGSTLLADAAFAYGRHCRRRCHFNPSGRTVCRTVCYGHGNASGDLAVLSSTSALLFSTSALDNLDEKQLMVVQATEDAAEFLATGRKSGILPSLLQLSREAAAREAGTELAAQMSDEELVEGIIESAEKLLEN